MTEIAQHLIDSGAVAVIVVTAVEDGLDVSLLGLTMEPDTFATLLEELATAVRDQHR